MGDPTRTLFQKCTSEGALVSGVKELDTDKLSKSNLKDNPNLPLFYHGRFSGEHTKSV